MLFFVLLPLHAQEPRDTEVEKGEFGEKGGEGLGG